MGESIIRDLESQGLQLNKEKQSYIGKDGCTAVWPFVNYSEIIQLLMKQTKSLYILQLLFIVTPSCWTATTIQTFQIMCQLTIIVFCGISFKTFVAVHAYIFKALVSFVRWPRDFWGEYNVYPLILSVSCQRVLRILIWFPFVQQQPCLNAFMIVCELSVWNLF